MLPSQVARSDTARALMYRRPRRRHLPVAIFLLIVVAGSVVMFKWWWGGAKPAPARGASGDESKLAMKIEPSPAVSPRSVPAATPPLTRNGSAQQPPAGVKPPPAPPPTATKPPAKINMGTGAGGDAAGASAKTDTPPNSPPSASPSPAPAVAGSALSEPAPAPASPNAGAAPDNSNGPSTQRFQSGLDLLKQNKPIEARKVLTAALTSTSITPADAQAIRDELTRLNGRLVFGPEVNTGDPLASYYTLEPNDSLAKLPKKLSLNVDWRLLQRVNRLSDPQRIQVGQRIKVIKGPFHAVITKREFRMDLYAGPSSGDERVYVRSFKVGLGELGATPEGLFTVKPNSKLIDPSWTNPRTGEHFEPDNPKNPLGERWIGLLGVSDNIRGLETYGIHGTIEPESIGQMRSMGCVRMLADDVALVYEMLMDTVSQVEIRGDDYP